MRRSKRLRLQSGAGCSEEARIWLDQLPQEVCQRVALHVCGGARSADMLSLATTSPIQRAAVLTAMDHRLTIRDRRRVAWLCLIPEAPQRIPPRRVIWDARSLWAWITLMGDDVVELAQPVLTDLMERPPPRLVTSVISRPNLRVAEITDHPSQVIAVSKSFSIRKLTLRLEHRMPAKKVFDAMRQLRLVELFVSCSGRACFGHACPFQDPELTGSESTGLAEFVPLLEKIHVACRCLCRYELADESILKFWRALMSLRSVREVCLGLNFPVDRIPPEAFSYLQSRDAVRFIDCVDAVAISSRIGVAVREISEYSWFAQLQTREKISSLQNHPRLEVVGIMIEEGSEVLLPELMAHLTELKRLGIVWVKRDRAERFPCVYSGRSFATASPGVMVQAVRAAPRLSAVSLMEVRIPLNDVLAILEWSGEWLHVFTTSVMDQEEAPFERLEALLLGLAKYNSAVRCFLVQGISHRRGPLESGAWIEQGRRVLARLGMLRRRVPGVIVGIRPMSPSYTADLEAEVRNLIRF